MSDYGKWFDRRNLGLWHSGIAHSQDGHDDFLCVTRGLRADVERAVRLIRDRDSLELRRDHLQADLSAQAINPQVAAFRAAPTISGRIAR